MEEPMNAKRNYYSFLWHAFFLAVTLNFMEVNTVAPDLLLRAGASSLELGILTAIMIGGASIMQLAFAAFLHRRGRKKPWLMMGIHVRILSLLGLGLLLWNLPKAEKNYLVYLMLLLIALFSFSGSFANLSYMDLIGRSIKKDNRKSFFFTRQLLMSIGLLVSALLVRQILLFRDYPRSHGILFILAGSLLWVASLGFWRIHEKAPEKKAESSGHTLKQIWTALKERGNIRYYLILSNIAGISILIIPFVIAQGRQAFGLSSRQVGNFLIIQVIGSIAVNLLFRKLKPQKDRYPYKSFLFIYIFSGALLPLYALWIVQFPEYYFTCFIISGLVVSLHQIVLPGILLEISGSENRIWMTGITGAFNFTAFLFPLAAGWLIDLKGFPLVFIISSLIILLSFIPALPMDCSPENLSEQIRKQRDP